MPLALCASPIGHLQDGRRQALALDVDRGNDRFDLNHVRWSQLDIRSPEIFLDPVEPARAEDRHDEGRAGKQPGQSNLSRGCIPSPGNMRQQVYKGLIGDPCLCSEARRCGPEIAAAYRRRCIDLACEIARAERTPRHKTNAQFRAERITSASGSRVQSEYSLWMAVTG